MLSVLMILLWVLFVVVWLIHYPLWKSGSWGLEVNVDKKFFAALMMETAAFTNGEVDCSKFVLDGRGLRSVSIRFLDLLKEKKLYPKYVGGVSNVANIITAGLIALNYERNSRLIVSSHEIKGFFVDRGTKDYLLKKQIGGHISYNSEVVVVDGVVDDNITVAINAVKKMGCKIRAACAIVDREDGTAEKLFSYDIPFYSLISISELKSFFDQ